MTPGSVYVFTKPIYIFSRLSICLILLIQILCDDPQSTMPTKSPNDNRQYEALVLQNQMKILLISDPTITKSACSISVGVGSLYNPERSLGLAHYLQHMLFMGSAKFPGQNQYAKFIKSNSGSKNAFTSDIETNFYFDIKNSHFMEAVQRITNFFIQPTFTDQSLQKQRQAVQNQFALRVSDDNRRKFHVLRELASPPFSQFSTGNTQTLNKQYIKQDLIQFYNKYYSSNIINAVLCSSYSIQQMKQQLIPFFIQIPNREVELPQMGEHFTTQQRSKFVRMQSIKDVSIIQFYWVVEYLKPQYRNHVVQYLQHVLGYKGENSLTSYLTLNEYIVGLSPQVQHLRTQTLLSLQIRLTDKGKEQYQEIYNTVMDYIGNLQAQQYIYDEIREENSINFQFKQKYKVSDYVKQLATKMHNVGLQEILNSSIVFNQFEEAQPVITRVLQQMTPQNLILILSSPEQVEDPLIQEYLGVKYQIYQLPDRISTNMSFPEIPPNPFIPVSTDTLQFEQGEFAPVNISDNFHLMQDSSFKVCKGGVQLRIYSNEDFQFIKFYARYLELLLRQIAYPAQILAADLSITPSDAVVISIFGFTDTVIKLFRIIADEIKTIHDSEKGRLLFDTVKNAMIQNSQNFYNRKPNVIAESLLKILLTDKVKIVEKVIQQIRQFQYQSMSERIQNFWLNNSLKWIAVGNFNQSDILQLVNDVQQKFQAGSSVQVPTYGCMQLQQQIVIQSRLQSTNLKSSCATIYYEAGPYSEQLYYKLLVMRNYIDEPYFNQLRTNRQLAYSLGASVQNTRGVLGMKFYLISSTVDPYKIAQQIKDFVGQFYGSMQNNLDYQQLNTIKSSLLSKLKSPFPNMKSLLNFIKSQLHEKTYFYTRKQQQQINRYLQPIEVVDLSEVWDIMKNVTAEVYVVSKQHQQQYDAEAVQAMDVERVKEEAQYWQDFYYCCDS